MTGTMWAFHEGQTLMDNNIQILMKKIEAMAGNTAQPITYKEMPKMVTRTPNMDTTPLLSPQTLDERFRREPPSEYSESEGTQAPTSSRPNITPALYNQLNTQKDDIIDANNTFAMPPQEFDTIIQDTNNKRSAEVNTSTSLSTAKK